MHPNADEPRRALNAILGGGKAKDLETHTLDFKEDGKNVAETLKTVADAALCFANASGGVIVVGVADREAGPTAIRGTAVSPDEVRRRVYELSSPHLTVDAWVEPFHGRSLVFVWVPQSAEIHSDPQGRAPRRIGTDCRPMDPGEQARLREERRGIDWSASAGESGPDAVWPAAVEAARTLLSRFPDDRRKLARLQTPELLRALGVVDRSGTLLRAGEVLFVGGQPHSTPAIVFQFQATPGGEARAIERLPPPLLPAFLRAMELMQARRSVSMLTLANGQQLEVEDLPMLAAREALANAVIHRDYHLAQPVNVVQSPDLLVVTSPGPLVSGVTPENILTHPSKPRNACLMQAARVLGIAEEVGRGVDRMYREMISSGRELPSIVSAHDHVRVSLRGGQTNTAVARFVAGLPEHERDDTDTLLVLFKLCSTKTTNAHELAPLLQKPPVEVESTLRRLASEATAILEPTRQSAALTHPKYRLRGEVLKQLGAAVPYQRRTLDEIDRKVIAHVREYGSVTNRTVQNLLDVGIQRARAYLADLVDRKVLRKTSKHQRGPGVQYGPGSRFPSSRAPRRTPSRSRPDQLPLSEIDGTKPGRRPR